MTKEDVIRQIEQAFDGVELGRGVGLAEGQAIDDSADDATRRSARNRDEKHRWQIIPVEHLNRCNSSLSFFDAEGMRFHLPAFLIAYLKDTYEFSPVFHLTELDDFAKSKLTLLSASQRQAVRSFLLLLLDDPNESFDHPQIRRALDEYWKA